MYQVAGAGSCSYAVDFSINSAPSFVSIDSSTGKLVFNPELVDAGIYEIFVEAALVDYPCPSGSTCPNDPAPNSMFKLDLTVSECEVT